MDVKLPGEIGVLIDTALQQFEPSSSSGYYSGTEYNAWVDKHNAVRANLVATLLKYRQEGYDAGFVDGWKWGASEHDVGRPDLAREL